MMKYLCSLACACSLLIFATSRESHAQTIDGIALEAIKAESTDPQSIYYFPTLLQRLMREDTTLTATELTLLYYGNAYTPNYNPYALMPLEDSLSRLTEKKKYDEALGLADQILKRNPLSLFAHLEKAFALYTLNRKGESAPHMAKFLAMVRVIERSGVGNSKASPLVITSPQDAEAIIKRYRLTVMNKNFEGENGQYFDVYQVSNEVGAVYPLYFDITLPYTLGLAKIQPKPSGK